jgi:hypothetical protein
MSEKKQVDVKLEGLEELGQFFGLEFNVIGDFISQSLKHKLEEELGETVTVAGIVFSTHKSKEVFFLLANPSVPDKSLLISTKKEGAERFYKAISVLKKKSEP